MLKALIFGVLLLIVLWIVAYNIKELYKIFNRLPEGSDKNTVALGVVIEVIVFLTIIVKILTM